MEQSDRPAFSSLMKAGLLLERLKIRLLGLDVIRIMKTLAYLDSALLPSGDTFNRS
jgi:hypothetical protein